MIHTENGRQRNRRIGWVGLFVLWLVLMLGGEVWGASTPAKTPNPSPGTPRLGTQFMPISRVEKGMRGIGKTVIHGTRVETFDVEVLGILTNPGVGGDMILVRVGGALIEETGGIAAGMSGSPVYINNQLVGALSLAFGYTDHRIGLVTPIESMLRIMDLLPKNTRLALKEPVWLKGQEYRAIVLADDPRKAGNLVTEDEPPLVLVPVATPLLVSGLGPRAMSYLNEKLRPLGLLPVATGSRGGTTEPVTIEPGSAIGVQLARGDVEMTAIGTVTYVDGQRFLAFGHPMLNRGAANYFASGVYIHTVVPSLETPFKVGSSLGVVGMVTQDRLKGIGGVLGQYPAVIPVHIRVYDEDLKQQTDQYVEVVRDDLLSLNIIGTAALQAMDLGLDRIGPGTSWVTFEIQGEGLPHDGFKRENVFYSDNDISALSLSEFMEGLDIVLNNEFKYVNIQQASLNVRVKEGRETAKIEKVTPTKKEIHPGETLEVTVLLRPYRQEPITQKVRLNLPMDLPAGTVTVTVRGGSDFGYVEELPPLPPGHQPPGKEGKKEEKDKEKAKEEEKPKTNYESLGNLIDDFVQRDRNNFIVVEFLPPASGEEENGEAPPVSLEEQRPVKATAATNYVVEGFEQFELTIVPWPSPENQGKK